MGNAVLLLQPNIDVAGGSLVLYVGPDVNHSATSARLFFDNGTFINQAQINAANPFGSGTISLGGDNGSFTAAGGWTLTFSAAIVNLPILAFDASDLSGPLGVSYSTSQHATGSTFSFTVTKTSLLSSAAVTVVSGDTLFNGQSIDQASVITDPLNQWSGGGDHIGTILSSGLNESFTAETLGSSITSGPGVDVSGLVVRYPTPVVTSPSTGNPGGDFVDGTNVSSATLTLVFSGGSYGDGYPDGGTFLMDGANWNPDGSIASGSSANWTYASGAIYDTGSGTIHFTASSPGSGASEPSVTPTNLLGADGNPWDGSVTPTFTDGNNATFATYSFKIGAGSPLTVATTAPDGGTWSDGEDFPALYTDTAFSGGPSWTLNQSLASAVASGTTLVMTLPESGTVAAHGTAAPTGLDFSGLTLSNTGNRLFQANPTFGAVGLDQQDTLVVTATGGTFRIGTDSGNTADIAAGAAASTIAAAIDAVSAAYDAVTVDQTVSGSIVNTYVITFVGFSEGVPASPWNAADVDLTHPVTVTETLQTAGGAGAPGSRNFNRGRHVAMTFAGIDVRKSGGSLILEAFLQDGSSPIAKVTSGSTALSLYELQGDGTLKSFDFSDNTFKTSTLTTASADMVHQTGNDGATGTGIWTAVLGTVSGFTPGRIYLAQINNSSAVPPDQTRKFQYGLADGDLAVSATDGGVTVHAYASGEDPAALLAEPLASLESHGDANWHTATGFAVPGSPMDLVNGPNTTAIAAIQNGLATSANATALLSAVNNLNNLSALANFFLADVLVRPASGTIAYPFAVVVRDSEGLVVDLDAAPTVTATNAAGTDRSGNLSAVTHAGTGVYTGTYTVHSSDADEGLSFVATGTVSSVARRADSKSTVASADSLAALAAIQAKTDLIGTNAMDSPNAASAQANATTAANQATTAATLAVTTVANTATLLTNLATVEGHAANADSQSATAASQAASAATAAATAATQAASAATALGTAGNGLTNLPPVSLTSAYNLYLADISFIKSSTTGTDEYTVVWSKNGIALNSGVTAAAIQVNNQDGTTLLNQTGMAGPSNGIFYHNETANRTTAGAPVDVIVTATIDGLTPHVLQNRGERRMIPYFYRLLHAGDDGACLAAPPASFPVRSAPVLSVTDDGDGTGTASIGGAHSTARVTVYVASFGGQLGSSAWEAAADRVGNGSLPLTIPLGHYFGYAQSLDADGGTAVSPVDYFTVTDGAQAIAYQCLTAAQARIQSLSLPNLDNANVIVRKLPIDRYLGPGQTTGLPAILLTPVTEQMPPLEGVNAKDDVTYGVLCTIVDADNQEPTLSANLPQYTLWRQSIARAFRNQRLNGVTSPAGSNPIINAFVEPGDQLVPAAWTANLYASAVLLRFVSREGRGV